MLLRRSDRLIPIIILCLSAGAAQGQMRMRPPAPEVEFPPGVDTVEVPFELEGHLVSFPVEIGDETLRFILDTGASGAVLRESEWVERLGLEVLGQARVAGAGTGSAGTARVAGPITMDIGGLTVTRQMIAAGVGEDLTGMTWNGAMGGGLLSQVVAEIDYEHSVLRFHRPDAFTMPSDAKVLSTHIQSSGIAAVEAEVTIDGETRDRWLALDIGAFHTLALNAAATTLPTTRLEDEITIGWGSQGPIPGHVGVIDSFRLGDIEFGNVVTTFPGPEGLRGIRVRSEGDVEVTGNLGFGVLKHYTVFVDHPGRRLGLRPRSTPAPPYNFTSTGIVSKPAATRDGFHIEGVLSGTPAAEIGLRPGDIIVAVDGLPVAEQGIEIRARLIDPPPGTSLDLKVDRDGEEIEATLVARPLFESR